MTQVFQNVLTASLHGSVVIAAVIALRLLLKKTPKKFLCLLWLLAGIRLLMPFEIQSVLSLQPDVETVVEARFSRMEFEEPPEVQPQFQAGMQNEQMTDMFVVTPENTMVMETVIMETMAAETLPEPERKADFLSIASWIWLGVACCFGLYTLISYARLKLMVRQSVRVANGIWECDRIETAFILGFIRPQIYLPMGMSQSNRRHILAHERTHLEKGDHWIKMIGFLALAMHWFNPLVWVAYILLCKDIELACDERVVQFMELEERKMYSAALLNCSTNHAHFAACPVAFGEVSVKDRIRSVLNYKKPSFWISLAGVIAIVFVAVCLVTSPVEEAAEAEKTGITAEETVPETAAKKEVTVKNVDELLAAIAPDTEILLEAGTYTLHEAANYGQDTGSEYYRWDQVYDGSQLTLMNVSGLTIRGSGMHVTLLETDPRYAEVIALENCADVELSDITAGHTRYRGECGGGVVSLTDCTDVTLTRMGLYGCGVVGLEGRNCTDVTFTDSDVYECSSSAVNLWDSAGVDIQRCRFYSIGDEQYGGYTYFEFRGCSDVSVENCELTGSTLRYMVCCLSSEVILRNNLISGNRFAEAVMNLQGMEATLTGNKFQDNTIRNWYALSDQTAVDEKGTALTEDYLNEQYGTEPTEPQSPQLQIHVSTVDELIAAIGPDKEIILEAELYDLSTATGYGTSKGDYYYWEDIYDGPGLVIQNVDNMTIRSSTGDVKKHTVSAVPRYADVLAFKACSNITVSGFTAGHTKEPGSCAGGVLEFRDSDHITVDNCGLFGCGILGVQTEDCSDVTVKNTQIYECSQGGIDMRNTADVVILNTTFRDIGGRSIMQFHGCRNVTVEGEVRLPADMSGSLSITTPEQEEQMAFEAVVYDFVYYFRANKKEELSGLLASTYTGEVTVWSEGDDIADFSSLHVTPEDLEAFKETGSSTFVVELRRWSPEQGWLDGAWTLTYTVIRENGAYKVSEYSLAEKK